MKNKRFAAAFSLWIVFFWIACVAFPLTTLLARASHGIPILDPSLLHIALVTVVQAMASAGISALIALPLGLWLSGAASDFFLALPFGVPTVVAGMAWVAWLGRSGWLARAGIRLDWSYSWKAVILAQVVFNIPWIALWVSQARSFLMPAQLEAARTLGAGSWSRFRFVIWPRVKWTFLSATCQAWVFCALSFAIILTLGGGPPVETLETALYARIRFGTLDVSSAVACAVWEFIVTMIPWGFVVFFQHREAGLSGGAGQRTAGNRFLKGAVAAFFFAPYLMVFSNLKLNLVGAGVWDEILPALRLSVFLAALTSAGSVMTAASAVAAVGLIPKNRRKLRTLAVFLIGLPSGISALVLGLGLWLSYRDYFDPFSGSATAIIALQITLFFPMAFRIFWPVSLERPQRLLDAAATLGASGWRTFWVVEWPRWSAPVYSALAMVAAASLGEVAAVSLFYSEKLIPLPLLLSRWMGQYRFEDAQAVASLLLVLCVCTFVAVLLIRKSGVNPHHA